MLNLTESLGAERGLDELVVPEAREVSSGFGRSGGLVSRLVELLWLVELWMDELLLKSSCLSVGVKVVWFREPVSASEPSTGGSSCRSSKFSKDIRIRLS